MESRSLPSCSVLREGCTRWRVRNVSFSSLNYQDLLLFLKNMKPHFPAAWSKIQKENIVHLWHGRPWDHRAKRAPDGGCEVKLKAKSSVGNLCKKQSISLISSPSLLSHMTTPAPIRKQNEKFTHWKVDTGRDLALCHTAHATGVLDWNQGQQTKRETSKRWPPCPAPPPTQSQMLWERTALKHETRGCICREPDPAKNLLQTWTPGIPARKSQPDCPRGKSTAQHAPSTHLELTSNLYWCLKCEHTGNNNTKCKKDLWYEGHRPKLKKQTNKNKKREKRQALNEIEENFKQTNK